MMHVSESISLQTADMGDAAHSFRACNFPVVGGPRRKYLVAFLVS